MLTGGIAPQYGKPNLGPDAQMRWGAIANRLMSLGNQPQESANLANSMTRESIGKRLGIVRENSYIPPVGQGR